MFPKNLVGRFASLALPRLLSTVQALVCCNPCTGMLQPMHWYAATSALIGNENASTVVRQTPSNNAMEPPTPTAAAASLVSLEAAVVAMERAGDTKSVAFCSALRLLGQACAERDALLPARCHIARALDVATRCTGNGVPAEHAACELALGIVQARLGDTTGAIASYERALALSERDPGLTGDDEGGGSMARDNNNSSANWRRHSLAPQGYPSLSLALAAVDRCLEDLQGYLTPIADPSAAVAQLCSTVSSTDTRQTEASSGSSPLPLTPRELVQLPPSSSNFLLALPDSHRQQQQIEPQQQRQQQQRHLHLGALLEAAGRSPLPQAHVDAVLDALGPHPLEAAEATGFGPHAMAAMAESNPALAAALLERALGEQQGSSRTSGHLRVDGVDDSTAAVAPAAAPRHEQHSGEAPPPNPLAPYFDALLNAETSYSGMETVSRLVHGGLCYRSGVDDGCM